jgi:PAS domain S-box-containing protein
VSPVPEEHDRPHLWQVLAKLRKHGEASAAPTRQRRTRTAEGRADLRYGNLVEQIPAVVFTAALEGDVLDLYVSPQIESLLGYTQAEWLADPNLWFERLHPDDRTKLDEVFARDSITGGPFRTQCRFVARNGRVVWVHGEARLIRDGEGQPILVQGVAFDISEAKRVEDLVRASLREKETLLKEIHHRVKNNLQVTSSLLKLQADRIADPAAQRALQDSQDRIRSMALVHEMLYRSRELSKIDLSEYVRDLSRQLMRSHDMHRGQVKIETALERVHLPVDLAVPCGLLLNEIVSNALKHAFPEDRPGLIRIELQALGEDYRLRVLDDGVGMPAELDIDRCPTLGLKLIRTLSEQIDGRLAIRSSAGTEIEILIPRPGGGRA